MMNEQLIIVIELIIIFLLPIILIILNKIPFKYRLHTLVLVTFATLASTIIHKWPLLALGINLKNPFQYFGEYLIFIAIAIVLLTSIMKCKIRITDKKLKYKSLISSVAQEFMFRAFLFHMLFQLTSNIFLIILLNTTLFTAIHLIYSNKMSDIIIIFIGGIILALMYWAYPNLILISLAHTIFNYIVISNGHFVEEFKMKRRKVYI